jgi:hypothetical protein
MYEQVLRRLSTQQAPQAVTADFALSSPVRQRIHTLYSLHISMRMSA